MRKIAYILIIFSFISCEKEIDVVINDSEPNIVIQGNVSTIIGQSEVNISQSLNLNDSLPYPKISDAQVTITDTTNGDVYDLSETEAGRYTNPFLQGIEGHTYALDVTHENSTYSATSMLPPTIVLNDLEQTSDSSSSNGGGGPGGPNGGDGNFVEVVPHYSDPEETSNYYQFVISRNDTILGDIYIHSDFAFNGLANSRRLNINADEGDVLTIDMQCVDETVYDYLLGLNENINQSSATPTNPISNINNNALGYFKAHTSSTQTITIE